MDLFEEQIMFYAVQCGCNKKVEFETTYYYAYMILLTEHQPFCRYVKITKQDYEQCIAKYPQSLELDKISAQIFFGEFIYGKPLLYEGTYHKDLLNYSMSEIKEYFEKISTSSDCTPHLSAWKKLCKKEFQNSKIYGIVTVIWLVVMTIFKIMIPDSWIVDFILLLSLAAFIGALTGIIYMLVEKRLFLKMKDIDLYTSELKYHVIRYTPGEIITKCFIFKRLHITKPIDLSQVQWVYRKRILSENSSPDFIVFRMKDDKKRTMSYGHLFTENDVYHLVKIYNPDILIGMSLANNKKYKELL